MKKYWLINVSGYNGYSLMIYAEVDTEEQAINAASDADLFSDADDAKIAFAEEADETSIKQFKDWDLVHEI